MGIGKVVIVLNCFFLFSLTWAYLQEKLTTTPHGPADAPEVWHFPVFLNTIQSLFAATVGCVYLVASTPSGQSVPPVIPSSRILAPLALVAITSSLASPFGYASLSHLDYITFLLAKSCKLLPVMLLHVTVFRKRYPLYKYLVVAAVTAGVATFTLHSGKHKQKHATVNEDANAPWGLLLLGVNLLFDGLTNATQDHIFASFRPYSGPQMMCANNMMSTVVTGAYLLVSPWLVATGLGEWFGMDVAGNAGEMRAALDFMARYPAVWKDVLGFAACGAVGQVFICTVFLLSTSPPLYSSRSSPFLSSIVMLESEADQSFSLSSLHSLYLLVGASRHRDGHTQNVHHDPVRRGLWSPPHADAVAGCRSRLWRHRRRGRDRATGEDGQGAGQEGYRGKEAKVMYNIHTHTYRNYSQRQDWGRGPSRWFTGCSLHHVLPSLH